MLENFAFLGGSKHSILFKEFGILKITFDVVTLAYNKMLAICKGYSKNLSSTPSHWVLLHETFLSAAYVFVQRQFMDIQAYYVNAHFKKSNVVISNTLIFILLSPFSIAHLVIYITFIGTSHDLFWNSGIWEKCLSFVVKLIFILQPISF